MKACLLLFVTTLAAIAAQGPPAGRNMGPPSGGSVGPQSGGGMVQPTGGDPMAGGPTGQAGGISGPYQQFLQQYPQQQYQQQQHYYPSQQRRPVNRQRPQRRRQNNFNPFTYYMWEQTDNPFVRYMLMSGGMGQFNPYLLLLNN